MDHKTKLIVGTKKSNALAKVNITESRWQCKGPGDEEEVYFGVRLDLGLIYLYVKLVPESRALCRLICLFLALEDAISEMLDDKMHDDSNAPANSQRLLVHQPKLTSWVDCCHLSPANYQCLFLLVVFIGF
ncbi:hypothetical protein GQ55_5G390000 [Panicum hallii var. hallii]|uniref:Uncharacterized protein n=1 Tax=Panicum hallii var. hallii TaxID=1504633 RepID=A0A2T7DN00_9POAL|nr:hypothetical protein GQ55_5G390000 [Panicum hallii var. hallii]